MKNGLVQERREIIIGQHYNECVKDTRIVGVLPGIAMDDWRGNPGGDSLVVIDLNREVIRSLDSNLSRTRSNDKLKRYYQRPTNNSPNDASTENYDNLKVAYADIVKL